MGRTLRSEICPPSELSVVHCVQRCVRKAFLAGVDAATGKDYGHRREWIRRRMEALASVYSCDVLSYAILSNHLHIILRNRPDVVQQWSDEEVAIRWLKVFPGRRIDEQLGEPTETDVQTLVRDTKRLAIIRTRLSDISWFMRALSEPIARMANKQDDVTGRFWEGRFKAQRLTDAAGLLACAMYVDLNPVRAGMAETPDQARHTSAYDRIQGERGRQMESAAFELVPVKREQLGEELRNTSVEQRKRTRQSSRRKNQTGKKIRRDAWLSPLTLGRKSTADKPQVSRSGVRASDKGFLELGHKDYLRLLRWTGKQKQSGEQKRSVPTSLEPVVSKLGVDLSMWRDLVWNFKRYFGNSNCAGSPTSMARHAESRGRRWSKGQHRIRECFASDK